MKRKEEMDGLKKRQKIQEERKVKRLKIEESQECEVEAMDLDATSFEIHPDFKEIINQTNPFYFPLLKEISQKQDKNSNALILYRPFLSE